MTLEAHPHCLNKELAGTRNFFLSQRDEQHQSFTSNVSRGFLPPVRSTASSHELKLSRFRRTSIPSNSLIASTSKLDSLILGRLCIPPGARLGSSGLSLKESDSWLNGGASFHLNIDPQFMSIRASAPACPSRDLHLFLNFLIQLVSYPLPPKHTP